MLAATLGVRGAAGATATEKQKSWAGRCSVAACARRAPPPAPGLAWLGDSTLMAWYLCLYAPRAREGRMTVTIGRRELLAALGGASAAWPLGARAQKIPLIAWLDGGGQPRPDSLVAFRSGLNNRGYVDGRNVVIGIHG